MSPKTVAVAPDAVLVKLKDADPPDIGGGALKEPCGTRPDNETPAILGDGIAYGHPIRLKPGRIRDFELGEQTGGHFRPPVFQRFSIQPSSSTPEAKAG
jgi:hypothetical protein